VLSVLLRAVLLQVGPSSGRRLTLYPTGSPRRLGTSGCSATPANSPNSYSMTRDQPRRGSGRSLWDSGLTYSLREVRMIHVMKHGTCQRRVNSRSGIPSLEAVEQVQHYPFPQTPDRPTLTCQQLRYGQHSAFLFATAKPVTKALDSPSIAPTTSLANRALRVRQPGY
jgi:hypothetical protein